MIKMYNAEVLSKFPVVQHFPFGSLFSFSPDPNARKIQATVHTASQPKASALATPRPQPPLRDPLADTTAMPSTARPGGAVGTAAPWARAPAAAGPGVPSGVNQPTKAPWASRTPAPPPTTMPGAGVGTAAPWARKKEDGGSAGEGQQGTRAPWADRR